MNRPWPTAGFGFDARRGIGKVCRVDVEEDEMPSRANGPRELDGVATPARRAVDNSLARPGLQGIQCFSEENRLVPVHQWRRTVPPAGSASGLVMALGGVVELETAGPPSAIALVAASHCCRRADL